METSQEGICSMELVICVIFGVDIDLKQHCEVCMEYCVCLW